MDTPRRYIAKAVIRPVREDDTYDIEAVQDPSGDWVAWEDYARIQAEVERLREAGDEMAGWLGREWCPTWVVKDWNAAKEGKPSV